MSKKGMMSFFSFFLLVHLTPEPTWAEITKGEQWLHPPGQNFRLIDNQGCHTSDTGVIF
jgi:hypothetical protein